MAKTPDYVTQIATVEGYFLSYYDSSIDKNTVMAQELFRLVLKDRTKGHAAESVVEDLMQSTVASQQAENRVTVQDILEGLYKQAKRHRQIQDRK